MRRAAMQLRRILPLALVAALLTLDGTAARAAPPAEAPSGVLDLVLLMSDAGREPSRRAILYDFSSARRVGDRGYAFVLTAFEHEQPVEGGSARGRWTLFELDCKAHTRRPIAHAWLRPDLTAGALEPLAASEPDHVLSDLHITLGRAACRRKRTDGVTFTGLAALFADVRAAFVATPASIEPPVRDLRLHAAGLAGSSTLYVDMGSVGRAGDRAWLWTLHAFAEPKPYRTAELRGYWSLAEARCEGRRRLRTIKRVPVAVGHRAVPDLPMATGDVEVVEGSAEAVVVQAGCSGVAPGGTAKTRLQEVFAP